MASPVPNNSVDTSLLLCNPNISPKLSLRPVTPRSSTASTPRRHTVFACSESKSTAPSAAAAAHTATVQWCCCACGGGSRSFSAEHDDEEEHNKKRRKRHNGGGAGGGCDGTTTAAAQPSTSLQSPLLQQKKSSSHNQRQQQQQQQQQTVPSTQSTGVGMSSSSTSAVNKKKSFRQRWRPELHLGGLFSRSGGGDLTMSRHTTTSSSSTSRPPANHRHVAEMPSMPADAQSVLSADSKSEQSDRILGQPLQQHQHRHYPARGRLQPSVSCSTAGGGAFNLGLGVHARRESFLYRAGGAAMDETSPMLLLRDCGGGMHALGGGGMQRTASRASSVASSEAAPHGEDLIVTPFAQLLSSLRNVRANLVSIANLPQAPQDDGTTAAQKGTSLGRPTRRSGGSSMPVWPPGSEALPEPVQQCALETLDELDWCLDQVKSFRTSLTEMASSKFRKLLNRELSLFAGSSKAGPQISKFLLNTYMAQQPEDELATIDEKQSMLEEVEQRPSTSASPAPQQQPPFSLFNKAKTAAVMGMSRISGVQRLRISQSVPSEFGVTCKKEIEVYMQRIKDWGVNIFKIHELSKQHSLTAVTYTLLRQRKLMFKFDINSGTLINYLLHLEHHYRNNPYHNQIHGADVAQSMGVLIATPALEGVFSDLEVLAAIIAAAIHDVDHPGFTNQYLINTNNELAIMYNDESVLEQHHLAVAFKLLQDRDCDFLAGISKKQRQSFRKMVIEMVLATDMSKHMTLLADLKSMVEAKKVSGTDTLLDKYQDRILVLRSAIHLADLSNPTKPIDLYRQWNERILEEYWRQGDREKQLGLEISPMCDRGNVTVEKSQIGFIDFIVHPLYETWAELVHPDANAILDQLEENRQWYMARLEEEEEEDEDELEMEQPPVPKSASLLISSASGLSTPRNSKHSVPGTPKML
uniref:Phosphodiesterase n=1 Tax=Globodera rostochiensis TaxID=31243 RepID=A0A914HDP9_GLORO